MKWEECFATFSFRVTCSYNKKLSIDIYFLSHAITRILKIDYSEENYQVNATPKVRNAIEWEGDK